MSTPRLRDEVERIAADRVAGATALVLRAIAVLREVSGERRAFEDAARALCAGQPSMAGLRTAAALALAADDPAQSLNILAERIRRAPSAIARIAAPLIRLRRSGGRPLSIVTWSRSTIVERTLIELQRAEPLVVSCGECRPGREGVALALTLLASGIRVVLYSDSGIGSALAGADALVVGADAVSAASFMNKSGSGGLAALARVHGLPVFVLAGREKLVPPSVFDGLSIVSGSHTEVAPELTPSAVRNPYFEGIPTELISDLVTDTGAVEPAAASEAGFWTTAALAKYESILIR
jgi:translation initiation factor eIF-2B subunit delta